ncbi:MAG: hypothetical protein FWD29_04590 [Micrococcales bacterium]|nr:hypothetical protein [Micrococcales bacterium]
MGHDITVIVLIVLLVGAIGVTTVYFAASRIDRLHRRLDRAWDTMAIQLTRRASVAAHLALIGIWDPVTSIVVSAAAQEALEAPPDDTAHSELSAVLRQALGEDENVNQDLSNRDKAEWLSLLWGVWYRAQLARRFYNEAVSMTVRLRSRRAARLFHLAGRVPMPVTCDIDDAAPPALEQAAASNP